MEAIDRTSIEDHFKRENSADPGSNRVKENTDQGCQPFLVARVTVDAFNQYYNSVSEGEAPITLRFLEFSDGCLWIVELPNSAMHETTSRTFDGVFIREWGLGGADMLDSINRLGHTTVNGKEADESYGPLPNTPNSQRPSVLPAGEKWITFVVEVGFSQTWSSLERKALRWYEHPGIQFILLVQICEQARRLRFALHDAGMHPLNPTRPDTLPNAISGGTIWHGQNGPSIISLDNRRLLGIPIAQPLPIFVANVSNVDLHLVLSRVRWGMVEVNSMRQPYPILCCSVFYPRTIVPKQNIYCIPLPS